MIVDDQRATRMGLSLIINRADDLQVTAEAVHGQDALDQLAALLEERRPLPDVVLMDVRMPVLNGIDATARISQLYPSIRVLVLTTYDQDDYAFGALSAGASGFLLKDTPPDRMLEAIKQVAAGEHTLSPSVVSQVIAAATRHRGDPRREDARADLAVLNAREKDVAIAIGRGLTNAEISARHYLSLATVKGVVTQIFDKLGLTNRVQVAIKVHDAGWADD